MKGTSIRARLLLSLLPLFILAEVVIGTVSYRYVLNESHELFDYHLRQMALSLRDQGAVLPPPGPPEDREQFDFVVQIWSADGSKIYLSHTRSRARLPERATLGFADVVTDGERWRVYSTLARGRVIQVGQPFEVRERIAASAALRSITPLLIFAPIVALAIWWLVGQSLEPVERIASELKRRDAQRLDPVSEDRLPAEVEPMVRSLNGLLERLRRAFETQRAFVADAAHELRTPIAALKLQAGLLGRARDEASRSEALRELTSEGLVTVVPQQRRPPTSTWRASPATQWPRSCRSARRTARTSSTRRPKQPRCRAMPARCTAWCATWSTPRCATRRPAAASRSRSPSAAARCA